MSSIIQAKNQKNMVQGDLINEEDELINLRYMLDEETETSDILNVNDKAITYQEWNPRFQLVILLVLVTFTEKATEKEAQSTGEVQQISFQIN